VRGYFIVPLHLFNATLGTLFSAVLVRQLYLNIYLMLSRAKPTFDFDFSSFAPAFIATGLAAGYMSYSRFGGKSAFWIFLIPVGALLIRVITFPSPSVFSSGMAAGCNYFFGKVRCSSANLLDLSSTANQCLSRMLYLGLTCSAAAYSAGSLASHKIRAGAPR
jgi:hypothetical protein